MPDVIICANFSVEKLRGLGYTGVKFWSLPLKWLVTFTTVLRYRTACDKWTTKLNQWNGGKHSTCRLALPVIF